MLLFTGKLPNEPEINSSTCITEHYRLNHWSNTKSKHNQVSEWDNTYYIIVLTGSL